MFCPKCQSEYVEGITECADCQVPLVPELPAEEIPELGDFTVLRSYASRQDAELSKSLLEANGIDALIASDDAGGTVAGLELTEGVQLLVKPGDQQKAEELFQDLESLPPEEEGEETETDEDDDDEPDAA
jgi:hypothetical protein